MTYLDNAATTFPKPNAVIEEVRKCMLTYCGNAGRGGHALSLAAANKIYECRSQLCETFGASDTDRIFFVPNTTYGINAVIKGVLKQGDHVIISDLEHNAVWRPIKKLSDDGKISYDVLRTLTADERQTPWRICANIARLIRPNTKMVFCTHSSNICSATLPIAQIGALCRKHGIFFATDGAQGAGHMDIDVGNMNIDALCIPGHKGLYGPQGSGAVVLGDGITLDTLIEGGNGIDSLEGRMSDQSPERYEAGTLSTPAIAGLCEGIKIVRRMGIDKIAQTERELCRRILEVLGNTKGVKLYASGYCGSIILFNVDGIPSEKVAAYLDSRGICVRGGYHCAALAHSTLGTPDGGAVRVSLGMFNRTIEAEQLCRAIAEMKK